MACPTITLLRLKLAPAFCLLSYEHHTSPIRVDITHSSTIFVNIFFSSSSLKDFTMRSVASSLLILAVAALGVHADDEETPIGK